jgi:hypothetical protein
VESVQLGKPQVIAESETKSKLRARTSNHYVLGATKREGKMHRFGTPAFV